MTAPRVSVVVPFLNASRFLGEAIDSVRTQSFQDWELILVDDGSQDESPALARRLAEGSGDRIRYRTHPDGGNHGISASLNLGIREARGELVALLDSDDVWLPEKLAEQTAILASFPEAAMVYGPSQFWWSWTGKPEDQPRDRVERLGVSPDAVLPPPELLRGVLDGKVPVPCPCSVLLKKSAAVSVGGFEESFTNRYTDQAFYTKLFLDFPVFASARCWARYRQHPDSAIATMKQRGERDLARRTFLEWAGRYVARAGVDRPEIRESVRCQLSELSYRRATRFGRLRQDPRRALKSAVRSFLPPAALNAIRRRRGGREYIPHVGRIRFGDLRRLEPLSRRWGYDRGLPIDRYYIEGFLERRSADIRGRVLEIGDDTCTWRFGKNAVTKSDVLNVAPGNPKTTLVGDLAAGEGLPSERFDCIIFTETLHILYDFRAGLRTLHRMLKPGGVLLATFPGITKIGRPDDWGSSWYWSFTPLSAQRLFEETFPGGASTFEVWGNVLAATSFLWGLAATELTPEELELKDREYPVTITVRAVRSSPSP